jgi:anthranilate phosphoribosyltransferase
VLEQLGARIDLPPDSVARCIESAGIGFVFAPAVHAATRYAVAARRELKARTIFNLLGPLTNPARASAKVVGVYDKGVTELMARALGELGVRRAFVVHGDDGLDEISISGATHVAELRDGRVRSFTVTPADFGVRTASLEEIRGGDAKQNAGIVRKILTRSMLHRDNGPRREIVLANAAAALVAAGRAEGFLEGVHIAAHSIDSGAARERLDAFVAFSQIEAKPIFS